MNTKEIYLPRFLFIVKVTHCNSGQTKFFDLEKTFIRLYSNTEKKPKNSFTKNSDKLLSHSSRCHLSIIVIGLSSSQIVPSLRWRICFNIKAGHGKLLISHLFMIQIHS